MSINLSINRFNGSILQFTLDQSAAQEESFSVFVIFVLLFDSNRFSPHTLSRSALLQVDTKVNLQQNEEGKKPTHAEPRVGKKVIIVFAFVV